MTLQQPTASFDSLMSQAKEQFFKGLPFDKFNTLVVGLFSTAGMKRRFKKGEFSYDSSTGHYITAQLNMSTSTVVFYDSINENLRRSSYFDFALIARVFQNIHNYYKKKRNQPLKQLIFQQLLKSQGNNDCGCHTMINIELLIRKKNPAAQTFNTELIQKIRKYHFLLRHQYIHEFRLKM